MKRDEIVRILRAQREKLMSRFGIPSLSLFGSVVRDEAKVTSDVDVLVEFPAPPTFDPYMGLKLYLEDLLQLKVDLVTRRALKEKVRPHVEREALRVT
jgi:predicted nucleotidyltransferase